MKKFYKKNIVKFAVVEKIRSLPSSKIHAEGTVNKQLLDEVFVICGIINVKVKVISRAEGEADNSYRDIDNFAYRKNRVQ